MFSDTVARVYVDSEFWQPFTALRLTGLLSEVILFYMKGTYSIKEAQGKFPAMVREAESGGMATITRHDKAVAYVLGAEDLAGLIETIELLANPKAMKAIAEAEAGRTRTYTLDEIDE